jgi:ABC-type ATPase involved in cell division
VVGAAPYALAIGPLLLMLVIACEKAAGLALAMSQHRLVAGRCRKVPNTPRAGLVWQDFGLLQECCWVQKGRSHPCAS